MSVDWICKHHTDLGKDQLYAILQLRMQVLVVEQRYAYQDVDGQDLTDDTLHLMAWQDDQLVAYLRLLDPQSQGGDVVIGRMVTSPEARELALEEHLLLKGLEADVAVVLGADELDARHLYVAMTRGSRQLVICSQSLILG